MFPRDFSSPFEISPKQLFKHLSVRTALLVLISRLRSTNNVRMGLYDGKLHRVNRELMLPAFVARARRADQGYTTRRADHYTTAHTPQRSDSLVFQYSIV